MKLFARWPKPFVRNGYVFRNILATVPDGWIPKSRLNGISINTGRAIPADGNDHGGIIVFPTDAGVMSPEFWPRLRESRDNGVGEARHPVRGGRYMRGNRYDVERERFDEKSMAVEIAGVTDNELFEITSMMAQELDQAEVLVKSHNTGHIFLLQKEARQEGHIGPVSAS